MGVLKEGPQATLSAALAFSELLQTESTHSSSFFPYRGPQRQVFVAGVEVKATLHGLQEVYVYSENALASRQRARKEPDAAYLA
jgi:hypothetical protein